MISVVSPVYNAAKILPVLVHELVKTFEELQEDYENKFGKEAPIAYKNNEVWLSKKLAE